MRCSGSLARGSKRYRSDRDRFALYRTIRVKSSGRNTDSFKHVRDYPCGRCSAGAFTCFRIREKAFGTDQHRRKTVLPFHRTAMRHSRCAGEFSPSAGEGLCRIGENHHGSKKGANVKRSVNISIFTFQIIYQILTELGIITFNDKGRLEINYDRKDRNSSITYQNTRP